jgi:hypothetical protein
MAVVKDKKASSKANESNYSIKKEEPVSVKNTPVTESAKAVNMAFGRENYLLMLAGIGLLIIGFTIMASDKEEFGFGFMGLTLGPIVVILGFIVEFFAILRKPNVQ